MYQQVKFYKFHIFSTMWVYVLCGKLAIAIIYNINWVAWAKETRSTTRELETEFVNIIQNNFVGNVLLTV